MSKSFKIDLIDTEQNFQILNIELLNNGVLHTDDIRDIRLPESIDWSKGVVINGRSPIWLYAVLVHECHIAAWVAVYSPRDGGAVVVQSHREDAPQTGDIIPNHLIIEYLKRAENKKKETSRNIRSRKVIAFVGPPHSGKSVLINLLSKVLSNSMTLESFNKDFYLIRACPDGEGSWSSEVDESISKIIRYKNDFDDEFVEKICTTIENLKQEKSLIFVDCGGKIDAKNQKIWNLCTDAIIVSREMADIPKWEGACSASDLNILCRVHSLTEKTCKLIDATLPLYELGYLSRNGDMLPEIPNEIIDIIIRGEQ